MKGAATRNSFAVVLVAAALVTSCGHDDGLALVWTRVPGDGAVLGAPGDEEMWGVTAFGAGVVAVGHDGSSAAVWTSPDGVTWTRVPHDEPIFGGPGSQAMVDVTAFGAGLVAVGSEYSYQEPEPDQVAAVWTSPDGVTWTRVPHDESIFGGPDLQAMGAVAVFGAGLVAVGTEFPDGGVDAGDAAVWTSPDGVTWTRVPHDETIFGGPEDQGMFGVVVGGPGLVAVGLEWSDGEADAAVWTSPDGGTWTRVPHDETIFGGPEDQGMFGVVVGGSGLVAVGSVHSGGDRDAAVWVSPSD